MNTMANTISVEADILLCGFNVGFFDNSDIERWADRHIAAIEHPPIELIDLSMIRETHPIDVMKLLSSLGVTDLATSIQTRIGFIGLLLEKQRIDTHLAIRGLWEMVHEPGTTGEQRSQFYYFDDAYDLAAGGTYGNMDDVQRELLVFVSPYAERLAELCPQLIRATK